METEPQPSLPQLTGSEKQVTWAVQIRAVRLAEMQRHRDENAAALAVSGRQNKPDVVEALAYEAELFASIRGHSDATWWIDRRDVELGMLAREEHNLRQQLELQARREIRETDPAPTPLPPRGYQRPPKGHTTH